MNGIDYIVKLKGLSLYQHFPGNVKSDLGVSGGVLPMGHSMKEMLPVSPPDEEVKGSASVRHLVDRFDGSLRDRIFGAYGAAYGVYSEMLAEAEDSMALARERDGTPLSYSTRCLKLRVEILCRICVNLKRLMNHNYSGVILFYGSDGEMASHYDNPVSRGQSARFCLSSMGRDMAEAFGSGPSWSCPDAMVAGAMEAIPERLYPRLSKQAIFSSILMKPFDIENMEWLVTLNFSRSCVYSLGEASVPVALRDGDIVVMDARNTKHGVGSIGPLMNRYGGPWDGVRIGIVAWEGKTRSDRGGENDWFDDVGSGLQDLYGDSSDDE